MSEAEIPPPAQELPRIAVAFETRCLLEPVGSGSWVLAEPFAATVTREDGSTFPITVPVGFRTDLASVPRIPGVFTLFGGRAPRAAVLHDYLYSQLGDREFADGVFYAAMAHDENQFTRDWMWAGVRVAGWTRYLRPPTDYPPKEIQT